MQQPPDGRATQALAHKVRRRHCTRYNLLKAHLTSERTRHITSDRKAAANCLNARKSTGPRTPEGKAAVRLSALKHGLLYQEVLLPGELVLWLAVVMKVIYIF